MLLSIDIQCNYNTVYIDNINKKLISELIPNYCIKNNTQNLETLNKNTYIINSPILMEINNYLDNITTYSLHKNEIIEIKILKEIITELPLYDNESIYKNTCKYENIYKFNIATLFEKSHPPVSSNQKNIISSIYNGLKNVTSFNPETLNRNRGKSNPEPVNEPIRLPKKSNSWNFTNRFKVNGGKSRRYRTKKNRKRKTRRV
jgi:hypothetical protein